MSKVLRASGVIIIVVAILVIALGNGYMEPAPESGNGFPNGSGFDSDVGLGPGHAPNSGDGIPDGSGF